MPSDRHQPVNAVYQHVVTFCNRTGQCPVCKVENYNELTALECLHGACLCVTQHWNKDNILIWMAVSRTVAQEICYTALSSPAPSVKHKCMAAVLQWCVCVWIYLHAPIHLMVCTGANFNHDAIRFLQDMYCCYLLCNVLQNIVQGVMSVCTGWDEGQSRQLKQRARLWRDSGRSEGNKSQTRRNLRYHWTSLTRHQKNRIIWSSTQRSTKLVSAFSLWFI